MDTLPIQILGQLLQVHSPSGDEGAMKAFLTRYFQENESKFKVKPVLLYGDDYQDCLAVVFGTPRVAVFAHMDTTGFMVRYGRELIEIGSPEVESGWALAAVGEQEDKEYTLLVEDRGEDISLFYQSEEELPRGTELVFKPKLSADKEFIQSPYLDNRIGLLNALMLAESLENGILVFSCWEEHHGGSASFMGRMVYERFGVRQVLISDVTWESHGVHTTQGAVISLRDAGIPRRAYVQKILALAKEAGVPFQMEVEYAGGSDGNELQRSPYPMDWCFVGAAISGMHSPLERIYIPDFEAMQALYRYLMEKL